MPATDETWRNQRTLHVVFAISSIVMTLAIVWMILADHLRPWKKVQREFFRIERAKLEASEREAKEEELRKNRAELAEVETQIGAARDLQKQNARAIAKQQRKIDHLEAEWLKIDEKYRFQKAELDSRRSFYDEMIDRDEEAQAREYLNTAIKDAEDLLRKYERDKQGVEAQRAEARSVLADLRGHIDDLEKKKEGLLRDSLRIERVLEQKAQQTGVGTGPMGRLLATLRDLPIIDLAAPPEKIQQISLPNLTINYNFKEVPRYDRCTTCHMGIDRNNYDTDARGNPMPAVYASHPHLTGGVTKYDPATRKESTVGLYLDANGPHPINDFGCTICHGGQGSGTDFTFASHEPSDLKERDTWEHKYGWRSIHMWDFPMLPSRFLESSCVKCHHQVTDIPQAPQLQKGYRRIVKYGCTGCHQIGGQGIFGPDLTDNRPVGPNLKHVGSKVSRDWALKWITNPHAFRTDTRMPRFFGLSNNDTPDDWSKNYAEVHAIAHYLFAKSTPPGDFVDPPAKKDPARGKELFLQKGCLACHSHRPYDVAHLPEYDRKQYNPDAKQMYDPGTFPESVRDYAKADQGPNLSNLADKFPTKEKGYRWVYNWLKAPEKYHPDTLMPNPQLADQDAADIAAWLLSVKPAWPQQVEVPAADSPAVRKAIDELVGLYKGKSGTPLSQLDSVVGGMSQDEKLMFLGERTISRLGCFGCHSIAGFENAKPIGTPLNGWGSKSPSKLDFAHIAEFLTDRPADAPDAYYTEQLGHQTRMGFLFQKLHRPRSYDYRKTKEELKTWDERLRMPQFAWANDPGAIEEVMTFVLGLTGEAIDGRYMPGPKYTPEQTAVAAGMKLIEQYNCKGCHVLDMPKFTIPAGTPIAKAMPQLESNVDNSYRGGGLSRNADYLELYPELKLTYDPKAKTPPKLEPEDGKSVTLEGMPVQVFEDEVTVQLWSPVTVRGYTFNVGDQVALDRTRVKETKPDGGNFAWLYAAYQAEKTGADYTGIWNRLPPPLLREGLKVQTPWLTAFLADPYRIRPAANLRMPRFHFLNTLRETRDLANHFAAHDHADFPYQQVPEREQTYLAEREAKQSNYLSGGWQLMTKGACIQCHAVGQYQPTGGANVVNGPDLRQVHDRFRSEYLTRWLANPPRLLPYTAMPQNIPPHGPPPPGVPKWLAGRPIDQVKAVRDTLLNYVNAVEQQLAGSDTSGSRDKSTAEKTSGGGQ